MKNTMKFRFPNMSTWEKLLMRWSEFPTCGEKRLICAVIAQAIVDQRIDGNMFAVAAGHNFWGNPLEKYCRMIELNAVYVREQVLVASRRDGDLVELAA